MTSKFALVIANTEYQDASFAKLTAPGRDADEFAQVLRDTECAAFDNVQVLLNEGESKTRRSIARFFAERKRDDLLLLYFSGHGVRNEMGQLFLAANDTEISILEASGIPSDFVTQSMNNSRSQRQLLILDCCNSGAFAHGSKSATGIGKSMGIATAFEGSGFGRVVLTATDATQYAWEGDQVIGNTQKSVFTHFLIEGLKGEADRDGDGRIHVDELYDYAYEQIVTRTPKQTPGKWSYKQQGDLVLRENLKSHEIKLAPLPAELLEMLGHPNSGVRRAGIQELASLLDGKHQGLARAAREKLLEIAENDDSLTLRRSVSDVLKARGFVLEQVIQQSDSYSFQQASLPAPIEIPKAEHKEERQALTTEGRVEGNIEKTTAIHPRESLFPNKTEQGMAEKSAFKLRLLGWIPAGFLIVTLFFSLGVVIFNNWSAIFTLPTLQVISTPTLGIGSTMISGKDGMTLVYVSAGEFTMGSDNGDSDETPVHQVLLNSFWIDKTEISNEMYMKCVEAGLCKMPTTNGSYTRLSYYGDSNFNNYPVIYVDWNMASAYCEWVDRRLPTEAEWEKAARGKNAFVYPWGNAFAGKRLNYCDKNCSFDWAKEWADTLVDDNFADTAPLGSYPNGASPYGVLDMAGNVWEWVFDLYSDIYYISSPQSNPSGPNLGQNRVIRGGGWDNQKYNIRTTIRNGASPNDANSDTGFRCALSATP